MMMMTMIRASRTEVTSVRNASSWGTIVEEGVEEGVGDGKSRSFTANNLAVT